MSARRRRTSNLSPLQAEARLAGIRFASLFSPPSPAVSEISQLDISEESPFFSALPSPVLPPTTSAEFEEAIPLFFMHAHISEVGGTYFFSVFARKEETDTSKRIAKLNCADFENINFQDPYTTFNSITSWVKCDKCLTWYPKGAAGKRCRGEASTGHTSSHIDTVLSALSLARSTDGFWTLLRTHNNDYAVTEFGRQLPDGQQRATIPGDLPPLAPPTTNNSNEEMSRGPGLPVGLELPNYIDSSENAILQKMRDTTRTSKLVRLLRVAPADIPVVTDFLDHPTSLTSFEDVKDKVVFGTSPELVEEVSELKKLLEAYVKAFGPADEVEAFITSHRRMAAFCAKMGFDSSKEDQEATILDDLRVQLDTSEGMANRMVQAIYFAIWVAICCGNANDLFTSARGLQGLGVFSGMHTRNIGSICEWFRRVGTERTGGGYSQPITISGGRTINVWPIPDIFSLTTDPARKTTWLTRFEAGRYPRGVSGVMGQEGYTPGPQPGALLPLYRQVSPMVEQALLPGGRASVFGSFGLWNSTSIGVLPSTTNVIPAGMGVRRSVPSGFKAGSRAFELLQIQNPVSDPYCTVFAFNSTVPVEFQIPITPELKSTCPPGGFSPSTLKPVVDGAVTINAWDTKGEFWYLPMDFDKEFASGKPVSLLAYTKMPDGTGHYDALMPVVDGKMSYFPCGGAAVRMLRDGSKALIFPTGTDATAESSETVGGLETETFLYLTTGTLLTDRSDVVITIPSADELYTDLPLKSNLKQGSGIADVRELINLFSRRRTDDNLLEVEVDDIAQSIVARLGIEIGGQQDQTEVIASFHADGSEQRLDYVQNIDPNQLPVDTASTLALIRNILPTYGSTASKEAAHKLSVLFNNLSEVNAGDLTGYFDRLWSLLFELLTGGSHAGGDETVLGNDHYFDYNGQDGHLDDDPAGAEAAKVKYPFVWFPDQPYNDRFLRNKRNFLSTLHGGRLSLPAAGGAPAVARHVKGVDGLWASGAEKMVAMLATLGVDALAVFPFLLLPFMKNQMAYEPHVVPGVKSHWTILNEIWKDKLGCAPRANMQAGRCHGGGTDGYTMFTHAFPECAKIMIDSPQLPPMSLAQTEFNVAEFNNPDSVVEAILFLVYNFGKGGQAMESLRRVVAEPLTLSQFRRALVLSVCRRD